MALQLLNLGVKNVHTLQGGYQAWVSQGGSPVMGNEPGRLPADPSAKTVPNKPAAPAHRKAPPRP